MYVNVAITVTVLVSYSESEKGGRERSRTVKGRLAGMEGGRQAGRQAAQSSFSFHKRRPVENSQKEGFRAAEAAAHLRGDGPQTLRDSGSPLNRWLSSVGPPT